MLNVLARLRSPELPPVAEIPKAPLTLNEELLVDVDRYERLRPDAHGEMSHVE